MMSSAITQTRPLHVADDVHHLGRAVLAAALVDDRQVGVEPLGVRARALGAADVGRHDRDRPEVLPRQVVDDDRRREQVVHRDVEERPGSAPCADPSSARGSCPAALEQVRDELGRNRHARLVLPILPRVAVVRNHGRDARRRRPAERVDHHAQLDQVLVDRRAGRLDDEDVRAADVLVDLERDLGVRKPMQTRGARAECRGARQSPAPAPDARFPRTASADREPCDCRFVIGTARYRVRICGSRDPSSDVMPIAHASDSHPVIGWGGRIRTFEYGIQSPAPYRLATPQSRRGPARPPPDATARRRTALASQTRKSITAPMRRAGLPAVAASGSGAPANPAAAGAGRPGCAAAPGNSPKTADPLPVIAAAARPLAEAGVDHLGNRRMPRGHGGLRGRCTSAIGPARPADVDRPRRGASPCPAGAPAAILVEPAVRVGRGHAKRRLDDDDAQPGTSSTG